jgi:pimeloyl-ACP methyl ester carboxylesterase
MPTYVLVHGAWHGSWSWRKVRPLLAAAGHSVFTPTLTGVGERSHLLSPSVGLQTHIDDVLNLIRWEELNDIILCGHSYGGLVVTGVAEAVPEKIASLIYIDAFLPDSGQSLFDMFPPEVTEGMKAQARAGEGGCGIPPLPAEAFGVNAADRAWVDRQCTPQPLATFSDRLTYSARATSIAASRFILATANPGSGFHIQSRQTAQRRGWRMIEIATGHEPNLDDPAGLVERFR